MTFRSALWTALYLSISSTLAYSQEMARFKGHSLGISDVGISADGDLVASSSYDRTVRVWSTRTRSSLGVFKEHKSAVLAVAVSRDGRTIASADESGRVIVWSRDLKVLSDWKAHSQPVTALAFADAKAKRLLTASSDKTVRYWEVKSKSEKQSFVGHTGPILCLAFSTDGKTFATGSRDGSVRVWELGKAEAIAVVDTKAGGGIKQVSFSPDGNRVVYLSDVAAIWDRKTGKAETVNLRLRVKPKSRLIPVNPPPRVEEAQSLAWWPDGKSLLSSRGRVLHRSHLGSKELADSWGIQAEDNINAIAVSQNGTVFVSGCADGIVVAWFVKAFKQVRSLKFPQSVVSCVLSAKGDRIVAGQYSGNIQIWDTATWKPLAELTEHKRTVFGLSLSKSGRLMASVDTRGNWVLWDFPKMKKLRSGSGGDYYSFAAISPDDKLLAVGPGYNGTISFFSIDEGKLLWKWKVPSKKTYNVAFSPDGNTLYAADGTSIAAYDRRQKKVIRTWKAYTKDLRRFVLTADGKTIASIGTDGKNEHRVKFWNASDGALITKFPPLRNPARDLAVDSRRGLIATGESGLTIFSISTRKALARISKASQPSKCVRFHPGQPWIISTHGGNYSPEKTPGHLNVTDFSELLPK